MKRRLSGEGLDWDMLLTGAAADHGNGQGSQKLLDDDNQDTPMGNWTENPIRAPQRTSPPASSQARLITTIGSSIECPTNSETFTQSSNTSAAREDVTPLSALQVPVLNVREQQSITRWDTPGEGVEFSKHVSTQKVSDLRPSDGKCTLDPRAQSWDINRSFDSNVRTFLPDPKSCFSKSLGALAEVLQEQQNATSKLRRKLQPPAKLPEIKQDVNSRIQMEMAKSAALQEEVFKWKAEVNRQAETITGQSSEILGMRITSRKLEEQLNALTNPAVAPCFKFNSLPCNAVTNEASPETQSFEKLRVLQLRVNSRKFHTSKSRVQELEKSLSDATKEIESLRNKTTSLQKEVKEKEAASRRDNAKFLERYSEWDEEMKMKAPLVKLAVDIRLRTLEQYRISKPQIFRCINYLVDDAQSKAIIQNGNNAAHRAYGAIDAAIFKVGLIPENYEGVAKIIANVLYLAYTQERPTWRTRALRQLDCDASLSLHQQTPGAETKSRVEREEFEQLKVVLLGLENTLSQLEFEMSPEVEKHVQELERLTSLIIDLDRGRITRPQDTSPVKKPTSRTSQQTAHTSHW